MEDECSKGEEDAAEAAPFAVMGRFQERKSWEDPRAP